MLLTILAQNNLQQTQAGLGVTTRPPLVFPKVPVKWPEDHPQPSLTEEIPAPVQNVYFDGPIFKRWPNPDTLNPPDLIANLPPNLYDGFIQRGFPSDAVPYDLALLTPTAVSPQPQPLLDYPALPKVARGPDLDFPNIASITVIPPAGPTPAGRHHKRFKVFLEGRAVYFATRAEAEAARDRYRDGLIIEARAVGIHKIKVRRPRITQVTVDGRHPPDLAPAKQMARAPLTSESEILQAIKEGKMREEEEIAIALLLS